MRLKVDIIVVAAGDKWIRAAKNATKTIPIVMMGQGTDPVRAGHVKSLARPGGTSYSNVGFKALRDFVAAMLGDVVGAPRIPRQHALDIQSDSIARLMIPIRILSS